MGNKMQVNYDKMKQPGSNLRESVDILRASIKDLYELDEDNYQLIKSLQRSRDECNNRINALRRKLNSTRKITGLGLILTGIAGLIITKYIDDQDRRIEQLQEKVEVLTGTDAKVEESDG